MKGDRFGRISEASDRPLPSGVSLFRAAKARKRGKPGAELQVEGPFGNPLVNLAPNPLRVWESLTSVRLDADHLAGNGLFTQSSTLPAAAAFDMLRTRLLQAMAGRGWTRLAITSPTHGCGKSFVAANLALSLARRPGSRTVLVDLELRHPDLAELFGIHDAGALRDFLSGDQPLEGHFRRFGRTLALGLNSIPVEDAAELLQDAETTAALAAMVDQLRPDMVIYDMPHALGPDDVMAMLPQVDAVLLVADGTRTTAEDVRACERLFEDRIPLMGVVLNRAQDRKLNRYRYDKK